MDRAYHDAIWKYMNDHQMHQEVNYYLMHVMTTWGTHDYSRLFWDALFIVGQRAHELKLPPLTIPLETEFIPVPIEAETFSVHSDEGDVIRGGTPSILQYARRWLTDLLGRSASKRRYTTDHVTAVKQQILARGIRNRQHLTVDTVRTALKDLGLTQFNAHANYILMDLLTARPPDLTQDELHLIEDGLTQIAFHYPSVSSQFGKTNMPYVPYLLYKLFEQYTNKSQELRRYIHFQSPEALQRNDQIWAALCPSLGIPFRPTTLK